MNVVKGRVALVSIMNNIGLILTSSCRVNWPRPSLYEFEQLYFQESDWMPSFVPCQLSSARLLPFKSNHILFLVSTTHNQILRLVSRRQKHVNNDQSSELLIHKKRQTFH